MIIRIRNAFEKCREGTYAKRYMSNGMIHVQRWFRKICMCVKQILIGWRLIFEYKVQWQQIHRTVEQFSTNQSLGDITYPEMTGQKLFYCAMYLLLLDLVSKNQLSTNQYLFNAPAISRNHWWTCIALHSVKGRCQAGKNLSSRFVFYIGIMYVTDAFPHLRPLFKKRVWISSFHVFYSFYSFYWKTWLWKYSVDLGVGGGGQLVCILSRSVYGPASEIQTLHEWKKK